MNITVSVLPLFLTVGVVTASVRVGASTATLAPKRSASSGSNEEVCFQGFLNKAQEQLTDLLISRLLRKPTSDGASKFSSFPKVSQAAPGVPDQMVGCSIWDWKCMECSLCEAVYEALVETGSETTCDAACVGIVMAAGGGQQDPIADIVAGACLPLCAAIFESPLPSAHGACLKADRCPD